MTDFLLQGRNGVDVTEDIGASKVYVELDVADTWTRIGGAAAITGGTAVLTQLTGQSTGQQVKLYDTDDPTDAADYTVVERNGGYLSFFQYDHSTMTWINLFDCSMAGHVRQHHGVVVNESADADGDFRAEGVGQTHNLFLDADVASIGIGVSALNATGRLVLAQANGTAPDGNLTNAYQLYSADQTAGNACPHIRTENGSIIKIYKEAILTTALTTITCDAPGTPDYAIATLTNSTPFGFASADEGHSVLKVVANLQTRLGELETRLTSMGFLAAS